MAIRKLFTVGGNLATLYNGTTALCNYKLDPYNPFDLPTNTIRCRFVNGYTPTMGDTQTLVDAERNIWDIYRSSSDWSGLFNNSLSVYETNLIEVLGANTSNVTNMDRLLVQCRSLTSIQLFDTSNVTSMQQMCAGCHSLTSLPLFNTSKVTSMWMTFVGCINVESGALALYQQASTQTTPPSFHSMCFTTCGSDTETGAAELAQIPTSWGGTMQE